MKNYPKKLLPALLACLLALALCACSSGQDAAGTENNASALTGTNDNAASAPEKAAAETETDAAADTEGAAETEDAADTEDAAAPEETGETAGEAAESGEEAPDAGETQEEPASTETPAPEETAPSQPVQTEPEPVQTAPAETTPAPEETVQAEASQVDGAAAPAGDLKSIAEGLVGRPVSELYAAIGDPLSSSYVPSCLVVDGEDGELIYDGFIVYTEKGADYETVYAVF